MVKYFFKAEETFVSFFERNKKALNFEEYENLVKLFQVV